MIARAMGGSGGAMGMGGGVGVNMGGDSNVSPGATSGAVSGMGKHMDMGPHMTMTTLRAATPADSARAEEIMQTMRTALVKYQDYKVAEADGYLPYMESVPQDVYHFTSKTQSQAEYLGDIDLKHPGSLLYEKKTFGGYKLVGAMYSAPANYAPAQLDKIIPLGLTRWHAHTNICLPPGISEDDVMAGHIMPRLNAADVGMGRHPDPRVGYFADQRFGFTGTIADSGECSAVGGNFHPQIFGWMVHVRGHRRSQGGIRHGRAVSYRQSVHPIWHDAINATARARENMVGALDAHVVAEHGGEEHQLLAAQSLACRRGGADRTMILDEQERAVALARRFRHVALLRADLR